MHEFLTTDRSGAIPIIPVRAANLAAWLDAQPHSREWLSRTGFKAKPGTFAFLPGGDGNPEAIVAAPAEAPPVFAYADLPTALPEGKYVLQLGQDESPDDAALGWALGSYAFNTYREAKRAPATLVWPANADRAEVNIEHNESLKIDIDRSLKTLTERQKEVICFFFGIGVDHPMSLEDIGDRFSLTRERVRQIKDKAITKLRSNSGAKSLRNYLGI